MREVALDGPSSLTPIWHRTSDGNHLAFHYLDPQPHQLLDPTRALLLDGSRPIRGQPIVCGTCAQEISEAELAFGIVAP